MKKKVKKNTSERGREHHQQFQKYKIKSNNHRARCRMAMHHYHCVDS
jgi:hypothetical protein